MAIKPRNIGHRFAKLAVSGNRLVGDAAQLLASRWPEVKQRVAPSPAGEALLARAGATEASEIQVPENQIAEAPTESNLR